ncbi:hypothetical protein BJ741DRAFT_583223 [Chytriomyces cf. hyalinus JEL632]|nr:hypothetical protein BJ741DRAFT_583223 [Chytriomyces cf. hyalinus JEL632]
MPLTKEQSNRVRHEVDNEGLENKVTCKDRIAALSMEFKCKLATVKKKRKNAIHAHAARATGSNPTCDQQPEENPLLHELNEVLIQKPRKLQLVVSEKTTGYQMFLRTLGKELEDANKELKREGSQAALLKMSEFQMITSDDGGSAEIQEVQQKAYSVMMAGIRYFVKTGGTHIGTSRLPYKSDDKRRIVTVAEGELAEETVRQTDKAAIQYQTKKVLTFFDLKRRMGEKEDNGRIISHPKKVDGGVQIRRTAFQADLLKKFQMFKPDAKKAPLKELREGKVHGVQMINWPSSVAKSPNFNEKELETLERNAVSLIESTDQADGFEMQVLDVGMISGRSFNSARMDFPAGDRVEQSRQLTLDANGDDMGLNGTDLDALVTLLGVPITGI